MEHPTEISWASRAHPSLSVALALTCLLVPSMAMAIQPLSEFLAGTRNQSTDARIAALGAVQQQADALVALGRNLPSVSARGVYTHNQSEASLSASQFAGGAAIPGGQSIVIQPSSQLDAYFQLDVPIIDVAGWARTRAAHANERAAGATAAATILDVEKQVARSYYQLIGSEALRTAAEKTLTAAQQNLVLTRERQAGGVATELDIDRASAEMARALRSISDAELSSELARRALHTLTGVTAEGDIPTATDDLHEEAPLQTWEGLDIESIPSVVSSAEQHNSADAAAQAAWLSLLPVLSGSAQEHLTNAPGFFGRNSVWYLGLTATLKLDLTTLGNVRSQEAAAAIAQTRNEAAHQQALDRVHEAWFRIHNGIAKSRAARAESEAAAAAVARARERYAQGASTQLELVQAERDAFSAEVSRIQADADLAYARAGLRLDAGHPLDEESQP